jgi:hypothetical protein
MHRLAASASPDTNLADAGRNGSNYSDDDHNRFNHARKWLELHEVATLISRCRMCYDRVAPFWTAILLVLPMTEVVICGIEMIGRVCNSSIDAASVKPDVQRSSRGRVNRTTMQRRATAEGRGRYDPSLSIQQKNRKVVTSAACEDEQMPDPVAPRIPMVKDVEDDTGGIENATRNQPGNTGRR